MMKDLQATPRWLIALAGAALALGLYARFKGLGLWPLGVDEYYISRSIDFVLASGLPGYPCGGYYQRGITFQYVVAGLRMLEMSPEFAGRLVTATCSLLTLPAAWLLGRRLHSPMVGWLAVILLALSVWEVEMARFARMYAPFQAVFCWYLLYFLRYSVDRDQRALVPMLLLSLLGVISWEGGVLLGATNFLPALIQHRQGSLDRQSWKGVLWAIPVAGLMALTMLDLRYYSAVPPLPDTLPDALLAGSTALASTPAGAGYVWLALLLPAFGSFLAALPWVWSLRQRWLGAAGLLVAMLAALGSQLLLAFSVVLVLLLLRIVDWRELWQPQGRRAAVCLLLSLAAWSTIAVLLEVREPETGLVQVATAVIGQVSGITDVFAEIVRPWGGTIPIVTLLLGVALAATVWRCLSPDGQARPDLAALIVLVILLALAIGASGPPRHETRYAFFLYPVLVVLGIVAMAHTVERVRGLRRHPVLACSLAVLGLFAVSEDFRPRHLAHIDSASVNFREGMTRREKAHYYPRSDFRQAASWLTANSRPQDIIVIGIPPIPLYFPSAAYSFLDEEDDRYFAFACHRGTLDRWSNLPLLHGMDALEELLAQRRSLLLVLYPDRAERLIAAATARGWSHELFLITDAGDIAAVRLSSATAP